MSNLVHIRIKAETKKRIDVARKNKSYSKFILELIRKQELALVGGKRFAS